MDVKNIRWNLDPFYKGPDDKAIWDDLAKAETLTNTLTQYRDRLVFDMPQALDLLEKITEISTKISVYFLFLSSCDIENQDIKKADSRATEKLAALYAKLAFFDIEVGTLSDDQYAKIDAGKLKPFLDKIRRNAKYLLSEKEESLLTLLSPFGKSEWDDCMDELESRTKFTLGGKERSLEEIITTMNNSKNDAERLNAMRALNTTLASSGYAWLRTRALNLVAGEKELVDTRRGLTHPMQARNLSNNLDDKTVEALHQAVRKHAVPQLQRYYKMLARLLSKDKLSWADRNAPLPFSSDKKMEYSDALPMVLAGYRNFSPTLANVLDEVVTNGWIDAPNFKGKTSGAYNCTAVIPGGKTLSYVLLNYLGTERDVMTLSHELGHAAHGMLSGRAQGALQYSAPTAYAETASIFGEMLTFEQMLKTATSDKEKLALLMGKCNDWINSVGRQICFSFFEQELHARRKDGKLSEADLNEIWTRLSHEFYGDIFDYSDMESLWSYVGHFMRPFYVYSYAFGELFTQSLYAKRHMDGFEGLYIDMLKSGSTKNAVELMTPFGLDPGAADFWQNGIEGSITTWLDQAEKLL